MSEHNTPDWSALPHDPIRFFELETSFDRKDLKRSYNRLIKQFKPEKYPAEFQKIRSAYEQLEQQLRYGHQPMTIDASERLQLGRSEQGAFPNSRHNTHGQTGQPTIVWEERLEQLSPLQLLEELRDKSSKTPYDYYCLAVLEDSFADPQKLVFARILLKGLEITPDSFPLKRCLNQFYRIDFSVKTIGGLLLATAKALPTQDFYFVTEPLWDQLLRKVKFEKFKKLYADCESEIRDHRIESQLIFLLHMLKSAMWLGDKAWVDQKFQFIEQHGQELPSNAEYDYDILSFLREYHQSRSEEFLPGTIRYQIDEVIKSYCVDSEREAERKYLELQIRLAHDAEAVLKEFPLNLKEGSNELLRVMWFLNGEISERLNLSETERKTGTEKQTRVSVRQFLLGVDVIAARRWPGQIFFSANLLYMCGLGLCLFIPAMFAAFIANLFGPAGYVIVGAIVAGVVVGLGIQKYLFPRLWRPFIQKLTEKVYNKTWRPETMLFLRQGFVTLDQLIKTIPAVANDEMSSAGWLYEYLQYDAGLVLYAWAQDYVA